MTRKCDTAVPVSGVKTKNFESVIQPGQFQADSMPPVKGWPREPPDKQATQSQPNPSTSWTNQPRSTPVPPNCENRSEYDSYLTHPTQPTTNQTQHTLTPTHPLPTPSAHTPTYKDILNHQMKYPEKIEKYKRNVLEITMEGIRDDRTALSPDYIADMCESLGMNMIHLEGHRIYKQGRLTRVDIWGKDGYSLDPFIKNTPLEIHGGWRITNFRLSGSDIRNVTITGLEITTNDLEVEKYFQNFGVKIISKQAKYCTFNGSR